MQNDQSDESNVAAQRRGRATGYRTALSRTLQPMLAGQPVWKTRELMEAMIVSTLYDDTLPDSYLFGQLDAQHDLEAIARLLERTRPTSSAQNLRERHRRAKGWAWS